MIRHLLVFPAVIAISLVFLPAPLYAANDCPNRVFDLLKAHDLHGVRIHELINDKEGFRFFAEDCEGNVVDAAGTAVHETLHALDSQLAGWGGRNSYYLIDGSVVKGPQYQTGPARKLISAALAKDENDSYAQTYLEESGVHQGIESLLDELNAYTHESFTVRQIAEGIRKRTSINPGILRMMFYLEVYLGVLRHSQPKEWDELQKNDRVRNSLEELWVQAETELAHVLSSRHVKIEQCFLPKVFDNARLAEINAIVGAGFESRMAGQAFKAPACVPFRHGPGTKTVSRIRVTINGRPLQGKELEQYLKDHNLN